MPTYEYECEKCGLIFDEFQSISAPHLTDCPKDGCGGSVKRRFSPGAGFIFKGSGFYITDYRSDSYKKSAQADGGNSTSNAGSSPSSGGSPASASPSNTPSSGAPSSAKPSN